MDLSFWQSVKLLAAEAVLLPDSEAFYRSVCRWYSQSFSTPLTEVFDLPMGWVLQNYYEHKWGEIDREELAAIIEELLETPEQKLAKAAKAKKSEAAKIKHASDHVAKIQKRMAEGAMRLDRASDRLGKLAKKQQKTEKPKDLEQIRKELMSLDEIKPPKPREPDKMPTPMPDFSFSVGGEPPDLDEDAISIGLPKKSR